jgi:hypothetical protein
MAMSGFVNGYYDVGAQLPDFFLRNAQVHFERDLLEKAAI